MVTSLLLISLLSAKPKPSPAEPAKPGAAAPADDDANELEGPAAKVQGPIFHWKDGPRKISLGHQLTMDLPATDVFLGPPEAAQFMEQLGNLNNENLLGLVTAADDDQKWLVSIEYSDEGYVSDGEKLDADELFKAIHDGTEEANEERQKKGFAAVHVKSWTEPPRYEKASHQVVWGLLGVTDEKTDSGTVNYETRVLGRKGYASLTLLTPPESLVNDKPAVAALLAATTFDSGARYEDYNSSTDKKAEYGLAGLILGGAGVALAAKAGVFGKFILPLLLAAKKLFVVIFAAVAAGLRRLFGKKESAGPPPAG